MLFRVFGKRWLDSRIVDPASLIRYEASYRLHVAPVFAHHPVRAIRPSRIQGWIKDLSERFGPFTVITAFLVLQGILDLALADEAIRKNPAKSPVVQVPGHQASDVEVWDDAVIVALADAHPDQLRAIPERAASLGMREGELFGLAEEDFDLDGEKVVRVRRQVKKIGCAFVFSCRRTTASGSSPCLTGTPRLSGGTSAAIRPGPTPCRGRSPAASRTPASCCFAGLPMTSTSRRAATQRLAGSPPLSEPKSSPNR